MVSQLPDYLTLVVKRILQSPISNMQTAYDMVVILFKS